MSDVLSRSRPSPELNTERRMSALAEERAASPCAPGVVERARERPSREHVGAAEWVHGALKPDASVAVVKRFVSSVPAGTNRTTALPAASRVGTVSRTRSLLDHAMANLAGAVFIALMANSGIAGPLRRAAQLGRRIAAGWRAEPSASGGHDAAVQAADPSDGADCEKAPSCEPLLASEARYRTLFECARDGIVVLDEQGTVVQANAAAESLLARGAGELHGMAFHDLLPGPGAARFMEGVRSFIASGGPHREMDLVRGDGSRVIAEAAGAWLPGGHVVLTLRDLSQRRLMEQALVQGEKLSAVGRLAAGVAHELRNPLFVISNVLHDLRGRIDSGLPEIVDDLQMAAEENRRARSIIDNLLEFARPTDPADCRLDPGSTIRQVLRLFNESLNQRNIMLEVVIEGIHLCYFNPDAFRQVMVNLISNAMDAMPGGGRLAISTRPFPQGGVEVTVADTGRGMSLDERTQVFTPFYSTKKAGQGTGLGLWIVRLTVERYRGRLCVESAEGQGTTFRLELAPLVGAP